MKRIQTYMGLCVMIASMALATSLWASPNSDLLKAASKGDDSGMEDALEAGANPNHATKRGHTALMFSVKAGCEDCVDVMIKAKADLNKTAKANHQTALMLAIQEDKYDLAIKLLEAGADPNITPKGAQPVMVYALASKNWDLIEALAKAGADLNYTTKTGKTLLHIATKKKDTRLMKLLLSNGANPNAQTSKGTTPLMLAAYEGCEECVEMLLKADADPEITAKNKARAVDFARKAGNRKIIGMLDPEQKKAASLDDDQAILFVTLIDTKKIPDAGVVCRLEDKKRGHKVEGRTNSKGQIKDVVYKGGVYTISCDKFGRKITFDDPLRVKKTSRPLVHKEVLQITVKFKPKRSYQIKGINFASGSAVIRPNPNKELDNLANVLEDNPNMEIMITGHTDSQGSKAYNIDLSRRRAANVRRYLIKKGIDPKRLSAKGYGPTKPIASNRTARGRAKNRRIMVEVIRE